MDKQLADLITAYEASKKNLDELKAQRDRAERRYADESERHLRLSQEILEHIDFDPENFVGGVYNVTDNLLKFLKTTNR